MASGIVESSNQGSSGQQQQGGQITRRSKLVDRLLDASANLPVFMQDLLNTMAVTVAGTEAAGFILEQGPEGQGVLRPVTHIRPDTSDEEVRNRALRAFQEIIIPCLQQQKDGAIEVGPPDEEGVQFCLVTLLRNEGVVVAVAAVITRCRDQERARQRLMSMQLVAGYFDLYMMRRQMESSRQLALRHQDVLQLTTSVATAEGFDAAAMNFCNELATRAGASRVSVGWIKGDRVRLKALSHTEKFDKKQELIVRLEHVMEECYDQEEPVRFDADGARSENVTREAEALCRSQGNSSVYSVPLRRRGEIVGIVTLEFTPPGKLTDEVASALAVTADLLAPQLWDRHENDRWIIVKVGHSIANAAKVAIGPKHVLAKLIIALVIGLALFITFYTPQYRVSAGFHFVAAEKRTLSAPFDGQIEKVNVKAGHRFLKGQVLYKMRTEEIEARLVKATADRERALQEARKALADKDPRSGGPALAQIKTKEAEVSAADIKLAEYQLSHASMIAPFDGEVTRSDLDDKVGYMPKQGEPLMEIVQTGEAMKAELAVAERDIHLIREMPGDPEKQKDTTGWTGTLATNALPTHDIPFTVERIVPLGEANQKEGDNTFKVYVVLKEQPAFIRPGMEGVAKIEAGKKSVFWIWTHRLVDWLRLKLWF